MPDYNIYIRTLGTSGGESSPTQPWSDDGETGGTSPANAVKKVGSFIQNPDSLIGAVFRSPIGKLGIIGAVAAIAINVTDKATSNFFAYSSSASGDFKTAVAYNNVKTSIHNFFHPFSNAMQVQFNKLEIRKQNLANEQQRLLLGGSFLNSPYGRYL